MAGVKDADFRAKKQAEIAERKAALEAENEAKREAKAKKVYEQEVKKYEREQRLNKDPANKFIVKKLDDAGDLLRSFGKKLGTNRMTSQDDEAKMQARKDVKNYKKGGMIKSSASKRADGCAKRGKTKCKIV